MFANRALSPTSYVQRYRGFKSRHRQANITCAKVPGFKSRHRQANIICAKVPGFQIKTSASQHHMCKGTGVSNQDIGKPTSYVQRYRGFKSRHRQANIICAKVQGFQIKTPASQHHMCKGTGLSNQDIGKPTSYVQRYRGFKSRHRQANIICAKVPGFQIKTSASQHHMCKGTGVSSVHWRMVVGRCLKLCQGSFRSRSLHRFTGEWLSEDV